jgi:hypothetical protein
VYTLRCYYCTTLTAAAALACYKQAGNPLTRAQEAALIRMGQHSYRKAQPNTARPKWTDVCVAHGYQKILRKLLYERESALDVFHGPTFHALVAEQSSDSTTTAGTGTTATDRRSANASPTGSTSSSSSAANWWDDLLQQPVPTDAQQEGQHTVAPIAEETDAEEAKYVLEVILKVSYVYVIEHAYILCEFLLRDSVMRCMCSLREVVRCLLHVLAHCARFARVICKLAALAIVVLL